MAQLASSTQVLLHKIGAIHVYYGCVGTTNNAGQGPYFTCRQSRTNALERKTILPENEKLAFIG